MNYKRFFALCFTVLTVALWAGTGQSKRFIAGDYVLEVNHDGGFALKYKDFELFAAKPLSCSDKKWKLIYGGRLSAPETTVTNENGKQVIEFKMSREGVIKESLQKLELTAQGLSVTTHLAAEKNIPHFDLALHLPWGNYMDNPYFLKWSKDGKAKKRGKLPDDAMPEKIIFRHDEMREMRELFIKSKTGCVKYEFGDKKSNWCFGDHRKAHWVKNFLIYSTGAVPAQTVARRFFKASVIPVENYPEKKENPPQANSFDDVKITRGGGQFENDFIKFNLFWKTHAIENFIDKKSNAPLIRRIFQGEHKHDRLLWGSWPGDFRSYDFKSSVTKDKKLKLSRSDAGIEMIKLLALNPGESILHFDVNIKNCSKEEIADSYNYEVGITPGRIEKEYNPEAWIIYPDKNGSYKKERVVSLWGDYKYRAFLPVLGLLDADEENMFLQVIKKGKGKYFNLKVGAQDAHGGRDKAKRVWTGITFEDFDLSPGGQSDIAYDWVLLKGLKGLSGYSDGLGMDSGCVSGVYHPGEEAEIYIDFASSCAVKRKIETGMAVFDKKGSKVYAGKSFFNVNLKPGKKCRNIIKWKVPGGSEEYFVELLFSEFGKMAGKSRFSFKTIGMSPENYVKKASKIRKEIESAEKKVPYLGAEYPDTLREKVRTEFFLEQCLNAAKNMNLDKAKKNLEAAEKSLSAMDAAADRESKNPAKPLFRKLSDRLAKGYFYSNGNQIYTPIGNRVFLWGGMDELTDIGKYFMFEYDPLGEAQKIRKAPPKVKLSNERLKARMIERIIGEIKKFGNFYSFYTGIPLEKEEAEMYLKFISRLLARLEKEGIWTTVYIKGLSKEKIKDFLYYITPECRKNWIKTTTEFAKKLSNMKNITHYVVPSPEPLVPKPDNPATRKSWTDFVIKKYGSLEKAAAAWGKNCVSEKELKENLLSPPAYTKDEAAYSPRIVDYSDFISEILTNMSDDLVKAIRESDKNHMIFGGYSTWSCWPLEPASFVNDLALSKDISGLVFDKYVGGWWGGVNSPPELWWGPPAMIFGQKPYLVGEWGAGVSMPETSWNYGFDAHDQSWGRLYAGIKPNGMLAWCFGGSPWCNIFDQKTGEPNAAARRLYEIKNELIANPMTRKPEVLIAGKSEAMPKYLYVTMARLASFFPRIKVDADMGDFESLEKWDLSPYKLIVCYAEGMSAKGIAAVKKLKQKVLLLGRPASAPEQSAVDLWINAGLFLKKPIPWFGRGSAIEKKLKFEKNFGIFSAGDCLKHIFAENKTCSFKKDSLLPDVKIIAGTEENPALLKQGNIYWWPDMLGIETLDMCSLTLGFRRF